MSFKCHALDLAWRLSEATFKGVDVRAGPSAPAVLSTGTLLVKGQRLQYAQPAAQLKHLARERREG